MKFSQSRFVQQIVLLGDDAKAVSALVVPQMEAVREYAKEHNWSAPDDNALFDSSELKALFRSEIDTLSDDLADFEKVRKIVLVREPFSVENGEMTPTLKIKRNVIAEKYAAQVGD